MASDYSRGVPRELTAGDAWTRGLLILMSVGVAMLTVLGALGSMVSMDPQDTVSVAAIVVPAGVAVVGILLACIGGSWSRWASGLFGTLYCATGVLNLASLSEWWTGSRLDLAVAAALCAITTVGWSAIVLAVPAARTSRSARLSAR